MGRKGPKHNRHHHEARFRDTLRMGIYCLLLFWLLYFFLYLPTYILHKVFVKKPTRGLIVTEVQDILKNAVVIGVSNQQERIYVARAFFRVWFRYFVLVDLTNHSGRGNTGRRLYASFPQLCLYYVVLT